MAFLKKNWTWLPAIVVAFVFGQSLPFKFTDALITQHIFDTVSAFLGIGEFSDAMRLGTASMELVATVLVLIPATRVYGALLATGLISGAIFFHLASPLGIVVEYVEANGELVQVPDLFVLAVLTFISAITLLVVNRDKLPIIGGHHNHEEGALAA